MISNFRIPGVQVLELDDLIEAAQLAAADADELVEAVTSFLKLGLAGATAGGVILSHQDLKALFVLLDLLQKRTAASHEATMEVGLARLGGVA